MRKQDMQVGETYAYGNKNWGRREKIRIISLDMQFTEQNYRHGRINGVVTRKVAAIEIRRDGSDGDIFPVESAKVLMTWAVHERQQEFQQRTAELAAQARAEQEADRARIRAEIERLTGDSEPNYVPGHNGHYGEKTHLHIQNVLHLIEQAVARAVNS